MKEFFEELGNTIWNQWKAQNFTLDKFPKIAQKALDLHPPAEHVNLPELLRDFLLNDRQPLQTESGFGQPELVVYDSPRFYIQLLFWLDGTTTIHQHEFSGAFHVMAGSSIHAHFGFENARPVSPHLHLGDVKMKDISLLETGSTVPIVSGKSCIHSLFHLDSPSITVVVRTQHDPGTGPQFNYLPPHVAVDPDFRDTLTTRRNQILDLYEVTIDSSYAETVCETIESLDFERGFHTLQNCRNHLLSLGEWDSVFAIFKKKHGKPAHCIDATLAESARRDTIKAMRSSITDSEHRFFLALLMNVQSKKDLLTLVQKRFPKMKPIEILSRWAEELIEKSDYGISILDAYFPETIECDMDEAAKLFASAFRHFLTGGKSGALRGCSSEDIADLRAAFETSSLRALIL